MGSVDDVIQVPETEQPDQFFRLLPVLTGSGGRLGRAFGDLGSSLILLLGSFCFGYFLLEHIQDLIRTFGQADGAQAEDLIHLILRMRGQTWKNGCPALPDPPPS